VALLLHVSALTLPVVELYSRVEHVLNAAYKASFLHYDIGGRLVRCFEDAGLATPNLIWESIAGGPASPLWRSLAMIYRSMLPQILRLGLTPPDNDPNTLADRLIAAATAARAQIVHKPVSCAWAIRP
jgi:hypothetical protein